MLLLHIFCDTFEHYVSVFPWYVLRPTERPLGGCVDLSEMMQEERGKLRTKNFKIRGPTLHLIEKR
jgi:hypothetical protein